MENYIPHIVVQDNVKKYESDGITVILQFAIKLYKLQSQHFAAAHEADQDTIRTYLLNPGLPTLSTDAVQSLKVIYYCRKI